MSVLPGTTCLLTESEDDRLLPPLHRATRRLDHQHGPLDPGDDRARAALAAETGRPATLCTVCGVPTSERFTRRSKSGKTFCLPCADRVVAAYYRTHPAARPRPARVPRERTGTSYLQERDRYTVRFHAGHARWQISDTQTRRWTSQSAALETEATAIATAMNAAWRTQIASEKLRFSRR